MLRNSVISVVLAIAIAGCSKMMPYKDEFKCQKGKNSGICASVSELYDASYDSIRGHSSRSNILLEQSTSSLNNSPSRSGKKCRLNECDKAKIALNRQRGLLMSELREKEGLIDVIHALSLSDVEMGEYTSDGVFTMQIDNSYQDERACSSSFSSDKSYAEVNFMVEVVTSYANVRGLPKCGGRILDVVSKGEQFFAVSSENGWYELEDGRYIHTSVARKVN